MSPYAIDVMLWYYSRTVDHDDVSRNPPVWRPTIDQFLSDGLLTIDWRNGAHKTDRDGVSYFITERGEAFVNQLMRVKVPQPMWLSESERAVVMQMRGE